MHADTYRCPGLVQCQTSSTFPLRFRGSFDHLIASCSHPKVYMPNCALALPAPCVPPFLHRNCSVALGVLDVQGSTIFRCIPQPYHFPLLRVAKCRGNLVAEFALDSICQNLSTHVTRTTLTDRRPGRKTAHSKWHNPRTSQAGEVLCSTQVLGCYNCKPLCADDFAALRRQPVEGHQTNIVRSHD